MPRFRAVLFDLDGTLLDSIRLILDSYHHTFAAFGVPPQSDAELVRGIGTPLRGTLARFASGEAALDAMVDAYRAYNLEHHDRRVAAYPGAVLAVNELRAARVKLAIVTSKSRHGTGMGLAVAGLEAALAVRVCSEDVTRHKPDPMPVELALSLVGATPSEALFVGDSVHDMASGRAAGVATGAALWGPFTRADLAPAEPSHWLASPADVTRLVLG